MELHPTESLEWRGYCRLEGAFSTAEIERLRRSIDEVYRNYPKDMRAGRFSESNAEMFRYEMFNRSEEVRRVTCDARILEVVEPLLGSNCHAISSTAWRNPSDRTHAPNGQGWHVDAGPFVPRPDGTSWPDEIPYPIFVIAVHVYLDDCTIEDGPTAIVEGTHRSGQRPPPELEWHAAIPADRLQDDGARNVALVANAGDVTMFVSDVWHRRLPPLEGGTGRYFLQTNYGRRDIAQRILPSTVAPHVSAEALRQCRTERERSVLGIHPQGLYDG